MNQMQADGQGIRQVSLGLSVQSGELTNAERASEEQKAVDLANMRASLQSSTELWPHSFHLQACPYPLVIPRRQLDDLEIFHESLNSAITNIVERWWTDGEARFPERMPLESLEEDVLRVSSSYIYPLLTLSEAQKWMNRQTKPLPLYRTCQGSWRPDFLLETNETYRLCEINARFPFNLFLHTAFCQKAYMDMDDKAYPLAIPAAWPKEASKTSLNLDGTSSHRKQILDGLFLLFDPSLPLHLLKGEETGLDIHQFISLVQSVTGRRPSLIEPSYLRSVVDDHSPSGSALHCVTGVDLQGCEVLERVHQVGLELTQNELRALPVSILRDLSLCCFNDLRTILLVHDKRMLGIVLQELGNLVEVQGVLTASQADVLRRGIAPTIIPGSREMASLSILSKYSPEMRNDFLLKPIRGGKGAGIIFGSDMSPESWISQIESLQRSELSSSGNSYIVQRKIEQLKYGITLNNAHGPQQNHLVGTYLSINGRYRGLGPWRMSPDRICALSNGGRWVGSVLASRANKTSKHLRVKARL